MGPENTSRRTFLKTSAVAAASLTLADNAFAGGNDRQLKVGLIGCGGRGTGAASQALRADRNVKLWAMGDAFSDRLESSLTRLQADNEIAAKIDVPAERRFTGFDAYRDVIACCDVVLLCTPPHFRPVPIRAAVRRPTNMFSPRSRARRRAPAFAPCWRRPWKPAAAISPWSRGLCNARFDKPVFATPCGASTTGPWAISSPCKPMICAVADLGAPQGRRLERHDLAHAQLVLFHLALGRIQRRTARSLPRRLRLGDGDPATPVRCRRHGGRQVRTGAGVWQYLRSFQRRLRIRRMGRSSCSQCRQQAGTMLANDMTAQIMGRLARHGSIRRNAARGLIRTPADSNHVYNGPTNDMYQAEHDRDVCQHSLRAAAQQLGGIHGQRAPFTAIMARMAAYHGTGHHVETRLLNSRETLRRPSMRGMRPRRFPEAARPGITRLARNPELLASRIPRLAFAMYLANA